MRRETEKEKPSYRLESKRTTSEPLVTPPPEPETAPLLRSGSSLTMLGKYLSLALMVPSGAFAGFLLGRFTEHWINASWPTLAGIVLGVVSSVYKVFTELDRDLRREERERLQSSQSQSSQAVPPAPGGKRA